MFHKRSQRLFWFLIGCGVGLTLLLNKGWSMSIRAQDTPTDNAPRKMFLPYIASGGPTSAPSPTTEDDGHTHHHQPLHNAWPPQPEGIVQVVWLAGAPSAEVIAAENTLNAAAQQTVNAAAVQAAVGERFVQSASAFVDDKQALYAAQAQGTVAPATVRVTYFSYSRNATVEVLVQDGAVTDVKSIPAAVYQPEPTNGEKQQAIDLARAYFADQGFDRVQQLQGYAIQAYQPEGATGVYENRVLYVTFHAGLEERPEFVAWVDLTHETINKALQDHYQVTPVGEAQ